MYNIVCMVDFRDKYNCIDEQLLIPELYTIAWYTVL